MFDGGKLLQTAGVIQVEGAGGAGLSTWAVITGYGTERSMGANAHHTYVNLSNYTLNASGAAIGFRDRLEVSYTRQWFDTGSTGGVLGLGEGFTFTQDIFGAKLRLIGDAVYDQDSLMPQLSVGVQHKRAGKRDILAAVGAGDHKGTDYYLAATKIFLDHSLVLNATARLTKANQFGLLGFGNTDGKNHSLEWELSAAYLISRNLVGGVDYRTKPDNLAFAEEDNAAAIYLAWFLNKHLSLTVAGVDLGHIANQGRQRGAYVSLKAGF